MTGNELSGKASATYPAMDHRPWAGGPVGEYVRCVLAPNSGPYTLEGTNTWIIGDPHREVLIVDPGPADESHADRVAQAVQNCPTVRVLITHRHGDHTEGIDLLAQRIGQKTTYAASSTYVHDTEPVADGTILTVGDLVVTLMLTPGHTADSLSATIAPTPVVDQEVPLTSGGRGERFLLSGDTVLGRGTTVISATDGSLAAYLGSLGKLQRAVESLGNNTSSPQPVTLLPGHGPALTDAASTISAYQQHRERRLLAVASAMKSGADTVEKITDIVYKNLDPSLRRAAEDSVSAQRTYLLESESSKD